ncbi:PAS domain-containing protein [Sphingomonas sp. CLY1604]|uniref:PAS domain-containing protein n=1 Tax=Sphingomonas sp. CLY1604 TaxID=3457786 RepID=UPI003FD8AE0F
MPTWPFSTSEAAARLAAFDWTATALGPIADWSERLKAVVDLVLASPLVASVAIGPERRLIYNDTAARLYGDRHPEAFGQPLADAFPDSYPSVAALYDRVYAGEAMRVAAQPLAITGQGEIFDAYLTPVFDIDGAVIGAHMVGLEVGEQVRTEAALREREADLIRVQRIGQVGGLDVDVAGGLVSYRSPEFLRLHGLGPEGANETHADWRARVHPDDVDEAEQRLFDALAGTAASYESEYRIIRPSDGAMRWIHARADIERNAEGVAVRMVGAHRDVTDQKQMQEALHVSEARQAFLLKLSDHLRPLADADAIAQTACRILVEHMDASKAQFTEVTGEPYSEVGESLAEFVRSGSPMPRRYPLTAFGAPLVAELRHGRTLALTDTGRDTRLSKREQQAFANVETLAAIAVPLVKGQRLVANLAIHDAMPRAWSASEIAIVEDVAERTWAAIQRARAEDAVRKSEAQLAAAFDSVPVGIAIIDRSGKAIRSNAEHRRFLPNEIIPSGDASDGSRWQAWDSGGHPLPAQQFPGARALRGETVVPGQEMLFTDDAGRKIWTAVATAPVRGDDGAITGVVSVIADIDAAKRSDDRLRDSEQRFRALVTAGTLSIYRMSADWRLMYQLDSQTLADTAEPIEHWVEKYIPESDLPAVRAAIDTAIRSKSLFELEHRVWAADGGIAWVISRAVPLLGRQGEIVEWFGAGTVVTERREAEEALRESEQRLRTLADTAPALIWFNDHVGSNTFVNQVFVDYTGRSPEEIAGEGWKGLIDPALEADYVAGYEDAVRTREPWRDRNRLRRADGVWHWFENYARPLFAPDGSYLGHVGVSVDVNEVVEAEGALRESEELQRLTIELVPAFLWSASPDGQDISLNESWSVYTGQSEAETQDFGWLAATHPDDLPATRAAFERAFASGEHLERLQRIHKAGNGYRWHLVRHVPVRDEHGAIVRWFGAAVDVHESKLAEQALDASERRLQTLIEGVPQLVWRASHPGVWTWASPQWTVYTGQSEPDSRDWGWLDPVHPDDRARVRAVWSQAVERGAFEADYRICHAAEDRYRWFQTRAAPVRNAAGDVVEWLGTSTDVDDMRSLQERQSVLVTELQHRTFNLMGMVRSMADATVRSSDSLATFKDAFGERIAALARVQRLLSRLQDDDRISFGELMRGELAAAGALPEHDPRVTLSGPEGVLLRSSTVQTFAMAVHELITNAVKYGALGQPDTRLEVTWRVEIAADETPWLHLDWHERGVTMPPAGGAAAGTGQGRKLIEGALPYQLRARTTYVMAADGVRCSIALPVSNRTQASLPHAPQ